MADTRLRGHKLQKIRKAWFMRHPLCVCCKARGVIRAATQLDHIVALVNGGKDFDEDDEQNRQGLCDDCHADKTRKDLGQKARPEIGLDGWPTDPAHITTDRCESATNRGEGEVRKSNVR